MSDTNVATMSDTKVVVMSDTVTSQEIGSELFDKQSLDVAFLGEIEKSSRVFGLDGLAVF